MAKILVADDNSNVQKTVALALTDLGVDVIAVNNGDAAIRKLSDISPDLVLADIFMPVRNGYEVCAYIKKDSRFANVPVVLLVGAFDPLDEREAQRVGADGILKKPFVPPDPLITMVKMLLDRSAGERLVTASVSKPAASTQQRAAETTPAATSAPAPEIPDEIPLQQFQPAPTPVTFGEGERPVAFGQFLETPAMEPPPPESSAAEPVDNEEVLTSSRDASLGEPAFWQSEDPEESEEAGEENAEDDIESELATRGWTDDQMQEEPAPQTPPEPVKHVEPVHVAQVPAPPEPAHVAPIQVAKVAEIQEAEPPAPETFEIVRDDELAQGPTIVEPVGSILQDPASQAPLTVNAGRPEDLAANPLEWMATAPPPRVEEVPEAPPTLADAIPEHEAPEEPAEVAHSKPAHEEAKPAASTPAPPVPPKAAAQPAPPKPPEPKPKPKVVPPPPPAAKTQPSLPPSVMIAEDTVRSLVKQEWADLAASLQSKTGTAANEKAKSSTSPATQIPARAAGGAQPSSASPSAPASSALDPASPDPALVEAVVQRVMDKMRPQVVDLITKEFLRPVVQALVSREIDKH